MIDNTMAKRKKMTKGYNNNLPKKYTRNTVVSNHFHSVKILLFSFAKSRDFDGMFSIKLPVLMYTTKTPIDLCRFNVRS
jgi:hypothetical protein